MSHPELSPELEALLWKELSEALDDEEATRLASFEEELGAAAMAEARQQIVRLSRFLEQLDEVEPPAALRVRVAQGVEEIARRRSSGFAGLRDLLSPAKLLRPASLAVLGTVAALILVIFAGRLGDGTQQEQIAGAMGVDAPARSVSATAPLGAGRIEVEARREGSTLRLELVVAPASDAPPLLMFLDDADAALLAATRDGDLWEPARSTDVGTEGAASALLLDDGGRFVLDFETTKTGPITLRVEQANDSRLILSQTLPGLDPGSPTTSPSR